MKPFLYLYLDNWHEPQAPNRVDGSLIAVVRREAAA